jgi:AcrR family transcriptional regulator
MNARSPSEPKGQSLRERLREATALAILEAAEEIFADQGLNAAHMNEIAAKAGVAVGTLYNHFEDRDALLTALLDMRRGGLIATIDEFVDQPGSGDFSTDLKEMIHRMGGYLEQHRRFHNILHQLEFGAGASYPKTTAGAGARKAEIYVRIEKLIKRGLKQKALRPELAEYYPGLLLGILRSMRVHQSDKGSDEHMPLDEAVRFFMRGAGV